MLPDESVLSIAALGKLVFGLLSVLAILGLMVLFLRFLQRKKLAFSGLGNDLKILQTTHLSPKQKLTIVNWQDMQYLIALTAEGGFLVDKKPMKSASVVDDKERVQ
jgi:flagellar biogenesis protein FliO